MVCESPKPDREEKTAQFEEQRSHLFGVAYRMLGTVADAEDVLQDAYLRWIKVDRPAVDSPAAFLKTIVGRLCIDRLRAAKTKRTEYIGPWLPEPLITDEGISPDQRAELDETVSFAFLVVLEQLSPVQRAVFLLHDVFDYDFDHVSRIVGKSEENCRQLARRARQHLSEHRPRFETSKQDQQRIAESFLDACQTGDLSAIVTLLTDDAMLVSDGGGKATAARHPIVGPTAMAKFLAGVTKKAPLGVCHQFVTLNGQISLISELEGQIITSWTFDIVEGKIHRLYVVRNPEKLMRLARFSPLGSASLAAVQHG